MVSESTLYNQLPNVLSETHFDFLGQRYVGKVRDNYTKGDVRYLITTDRLSCFDKVVTIIPFKGQVLNQLAGLWFKKTANIIANHVIDIPDPNVLVSKLCEVLPVEVVVRAYLTGSAWRDYQAGKAISGLVLGQGMRASQKLPQPVITPSTKAAQGSHDMPISEQEILSSRIVAPAIWQQAREVALQLFALGQEEANSKGLLLVDTKYEFGLWQGKLILVDEIHTLDSSRYWVADTYQQRFEEGEMPEMLDKEPTRQWLLSQGYKGEGKVPTFSDTHRVKISQHYIDSFERISGLSFEAESGQVLERIEKNLKLFELPERSCGLSE